MGLRKGLNMKEKRKVILVVRTDIDLEVEEEFNRWYDMEHIPNLLKVPGVSDAKRGKLYDGKGPKYIAVYEHVDDTVSHSLAYKEAVDTEWTRRLRPRFRNLEVMRYHIL
jgi:hypothetical protein